MSKKRSLSDFLDDPPSTQQPLQEEIINDITTHLDTQCQLRQNLPQYQFKKRKLPANQISYELKTRIIERGTSILIQEIKIQEERTEQVFPGIALLHPYRLMAHQKRALDWCLSRDTKSYLGARGGVLCLEPGWGKTLVMLLLSMFSMDGRYKPTLYLTNKSLVEQVFEESLRFFGTLQRAILMHRNSKRKKQTETFYQQNAHSLRGYHVIIMTYDTLKELYNTHMACVEPDKYEAYAGSKPKDGDQEMKVPDKRTRKKKKFNPHLYQIAEAVFQDGFFQRVVADEGHRFNNRNTQLYKIMKYLRTKTQSLFVPTGTPMSNGSEEMFALHTVLGMNHPALSRPMHWKGEKGLENYEKFDLGRLVYRPPEKIELPPKDSQLIWLDMTPAQTAIYQRMFQGTKDVYQANQAMIQKRKQNAHITAEERKILVAEERKNTAKVIESFQRCRQICVAPHLITPESNLKFSKRDMERMVPGSILGPEWIPQEEWIRDAAGTAGIQAAKIRHLTALVQTEIPPEDNIIIFSGWVACVHLVYSALCLALGPDGILMATGEMGNASQVIRQFQHDPSVRILVMTHVGKEGLNLTKANWLFRMEGEYHETANEQMDGRIHRMGQTKNVYIREYAMKKTVEEKLYYMRQKKYEETSEILKQSKRSPMELMGMLF